MKLSAAARRDPTRARRIAVQHEKRLVAFFREYRRRVRDTVEASTRNLAEPPPSFDLERLVAALQEILTAMLAEQGAEIALSLSKTSYMQGLTFASTSLKRVGITVPGQPNPADWRVIDMLRVRNLTALKGIGEATNHAIIREIAEGVQRGEGVVKLAARLNSRVESIGIARARLMAHTETMYACNEATKLRYEQAGITKVEWLTAGATACPDCQALDGKQFPIESAPPCPLHPMCRCTLLAVVE